MGDGWRLETIGHGCRSTVGWRAHGRGAHAQSIQDRLAARSRTHAVTWRRIAMLAAVAFRLAAGVNVGGAKLALAAAKIIGGKIIAGAAVIAGNVVVGVRPSDYLLTMSAQQHEPPAGAEAPRARRACQDGQGNHPPDDHSRNAATGKLHA